MVFTVSCLNENRILHTVFHKSWKQRKILKILIKKTHFENFLLHSSQFIWLSAQPIALVSVFGDIWFLVMDYLVNVNAWFVN